MTAELADLLPELVVVLRSLAHEMQGKPVEPKFVHEALSRMGEPLPGHAVVIHHVARSAKGVRPAVAPHYVVTIAGKRLEGRWQFRPGRLTELLKKLNAGL